MSDSKGGTLQQNRAADALEKIRALANSSDKASKYRSYVAAFPATIVTNGLGQALAIELASGGDKVAHKALCDHVMTWLKSQVEAIDKSCRDNEDRILDAIMEIDEDDYLRAQSEAIAYVSWLKRFATAILPEPEEKEPSSHV